MKITKVLNNNTVLALKDNGVECVVLGSGIGFGKKINNIINQAKIEKIYVLETSEIADNLMLLLQDVPINFIMTTFEIISFAQKKYFIYLQDYIYVTLTDHLYNAYKRYLANQYIAPKLPDLSRDYPLHYQISEHALQIFNQNFNIQLPSLEINAIALHFINSESKLINGKVEITDGSDDVFRIFEETLKEMNIVRQTYNQKLFERFFIHIRYFKDRIKAQHHKKHNKSLDRNFLNKLKETNYDAYQIVQKIKLRLQQELNILIDINEEIYLIIHIERLLEVKDNDN